MTSIWTLSRGDLFRFAGHILEFERMDGMYARAWTRTGQLINLSGYVEVVEVVGSLKIPDSSHCYGFGYVDGSCIESLRGARWHLEEILDSIPSEPLMTVAQYREHMAAKDAVIDNKTYNAEAQDRAIMSLAAERDELRAQLAEYEGEERLAMDAFLAMAKEAFGQVVDHDLRGNPITDYGVLLMGAYGPAVRRLVVLAGNRLAAQTAAVPGESMRFEYQHPSTVEKRTVLITRQEVAEGMEDTLYEKLGNQICQCEPVGETNVVDCNCDEYIYDFILLAAPAAPQQGVVMPKRDERRTSLDIDEARQDGWNACLDEFARLNAGDKDNG